MKVKRKLFIVITSVFVALFGFGVYLFNANNQPTFDRNNIDVSTESLNELQEQGVCTEATVSELSEQIVSNKGLEKAKYHDTLGSCLVFKGDVAGALEQYKLAASVYSSAGDDEGAKAAQRSVDALSFYPATEEEAQKLKDEAFDDEDAAGVL